MFVRRLRKLVLPFTLPVIIFALYYFQIFVLFILRLSTAFTYLHLYFVNVVFEVPFALGPVGEYHLAVSMLNPFDPLSLIAAAVSPVHFSVTVSLVVSVFTFVDVAASPLEDALALLSVILIFAFI